MTKPHIFPVNHIKPDQCKQLANQLGYLLADTYTLYLKTQNFHWNVTGPNFYSLHKMFEEQYNQLANTVDDIAEKIRTLDHPAPASFQQFQQLTAIQEAKLPLSESQMIAELLADHGKVIERLDQILPVVHAAHDEATANFIAERLEYHEKISWMLQSSLPN